jgi:hypothetical protein
MWRRTIVIGVSRIERQDFAVRRRLHMLHLAFSTAGEHASAAFQSIARAQSRGFEPCWPSIENRLSRRPGVRPWVLQFNGNEARVQEMADSALRFGGTEQEHGTSKSPAAGGAGRGAAWRAWAGRDSARRGGAEIERGVMEDQFAELWS